ncbi:MAG TPA: polyprenyl synthetase family protein [Chitinophagaceae bacterium]|nr:polyprenyl synthetase family protein [Chitinophagaceae bacterium]
MHSVQELQALFEARFAEDPFATFPSTLYDPLRYTLGVRGKRIRPLLCLMGSELFDEITPDSFHAAVALEMFHNFTLIHDDILDHAPLRRGQPTAHHKFGMPAALLGGDVLLVYAYEQINRIGKLHLSRILDLFNKVAIQVCEGQQLDMDFETMDPALIPMKDYMDMIERKTSVLLAASIQIGAVLGGASAGNAMHLYEFGKRLGMSFQVQDDLLDIFGDPGQVGKTPGGDILTGKKTFLLLKAMELCPPHQAGALAELIRSNRPDRVEKVMEIYSDCRIAEWAEREKEKFAREALDQLDQVAVLSSRKAPLRELAWMLLQRTS